MKKEKTGRTAFDIRELLIGWMISIGTMLILFYRMASHAVCVVYRRLLTLRRHISSGYQTFMKKWYGTSRFWHSVSNVIRRGYHAHPQKSAFFRFFDAVSACFSAAGRHTYVFRRLFNYLFPAAAVVAFAFLVNYVFSLNYAIGVECNGKQVGYVKHEAVLHETENKIQPRMLY